MIERVVYSYFNPDEDFGNTCGFKIFSDFLYVTVLSVVLSRRHFKEVQFISSSWGVKLFEKIGLPVTEISTELDSMKNISKFFWAYGKILAYSSQTKPFIHVDNDVFLWKKLPDRILNAQLCFQSKEFFNLPGYKYYDMLKPCWNEAISRPRVIIQNEIDDFAYNCGICGGHNLGFFKEWQKCSSEYIFAPENQNLFFEKYRDILIHQNLFHEQYFGASLVKYHDLRSEVELVANDIADDEFVRNNDFYTHLWGTGKRKTPVMIKVRKRLKKEDPVMYDRVKKFIRDKSLREWPVGMERS